MLTQLAGEVNSVVREADRPEMKEIKGLGDRLFGLEQLMHEANKIVQEQNNFAQVGKGNAVSGRDCILCRVLGLMSNKLNPKPLKCFVLKSSHLEDLPSFEKALLLIAGYLVMSADHKEPLILQNL